MQVAALSRESRKKKGRQERKEGNTHTLTRTSGRRKEKEAKGGPEDLVARVMLAVVILGVIAFLYT